MKRVFLENECANCGELNDWNYEKFLSAQTDVERINMIVCPTCLRSGRPQGKWVSLKNQVADYLVNGAK